ncbi:MAG TPA: VanZ family protein [Gemmataceae bacterium]|nr:VanZ family protein [Gemmataceae bacterium]
MPNESPGSSRWLRFSVQLAAFVVFLSLWTWKLLEPYPVPESVRGGLASAGLSFVAAKTLHLLVYTFLTVLGASLSRRWCWWVVAFLMLHGVTTEILQAVLPFNRTGRVTDVLIDWTGIWLGVLLIWRWNSRARRASEG